MPYAGTRPGDTVKASLPGVRRSFGLSCRERLRSAVEAGLFVGRAAASEAFTLRDPRAPSVRGAATEEAQDGEQEHRADQ